MDFSLLDASVDVPNQTWLKQHFHVLLCFLRLEGTDAAPIVICLDVSLHDFLIHLWNVNQTQLLVHLIEHVAEEVTSVLLLIIGVVIPQEWLKNELRVHSSLGKCTFRVDLILFVKIFTDMDHFSQKAISIKFILKILVLRDRLE